MCTDSKSNEKLCHICERPRDEEGEYYCSAAHPRKCTECGLYPDPEGHYTGGCQCKSDAMRALEELYNAVEKLPSRYRANLLAPLVLLAGEVARMVMYQSSLLKCRSVEGDDIEVQNGK
jgi:hypothetical protein